MVINNAELKQKISDCCKLFSIPEKGERLIYVLKLKDDFYYIGQTENFGNRMFDHFKRNRKSAAWTKEHSPVAIQEVIRMQKMSQGDCAKYESSKTIEYMTTYGVSNVRGGHYCSMKNEVINTLIEKHGFICKDGKLFENCLKQNKYIRKIEELPDMKNIIESPYSII